MVQYKVSNLSQMFMTTEAEVMSQFADTKDSPFAKEESDLNAQLATEIARFKKNYSPSDYLYLECAKTQSGALSSPQLAEKVWKRILSETDTAPAWSAIDPGILKSPVGPLVSNLKALAPFVEPSLKYGTKNQYTPFHRNVILSYENIICSSCQSALSGKAYNRPLGAIAHEIQHDTNGEVIGIRLTNAHIANDLVDFVLKKTLRGT